MVKGIRLTPAHLVGTAWLLWAGNYMAGAYAGFPFLYCWFRDPFSRLYLEWGSLLLYGAFIYAAIQLMRSKLLEAICAALIMSAVIELPALGVYVFKSGGTCG